jgi:HEPN domain-containing protein
MKKISEEWLKAAADDLSVIAKIISEGHLTHMVAFHSQQAIEKSLKAVMEEYEIEQLKIHNLERLFELVRDQINPGIDIMIIEKLDKLYIDARYPADLGLLPDGKPTVDDAEVFYSTANYIYESVKTHLETHTIKSTGMTLNQMK